MMETKETKNKKEESRLPYISPAIIEECEIMVDLQTNILSEEPPPPL